MPGAEAASGDARDDIPGVPVREDLRDAVARDNDEKRAACARGGVPPRGERWDGDKGNDEGDSERRRVGAARG